jgi:hypothetical protein
MATKVAVKYTYQLNGNPVWWQSSLTSSDPAWNENFPTWKQAYLDFVNSNSFASAENVKVEWNFIDQNTATTTYVVEGATQENIEELVKIFLWGQDPLNDAYLWKDTEYNPPRGIERTNTEFITVDL